MSSRAVRSSCRLLIGLIAVGACTFLPTLAYCGNSLYADNYLGIGGAYATIQAAVDAASDGDTIWVSGYFAEQVKIHDRSHLTIRPYDLNSAPAIIDGSTVTSMPGNTSGGKWQRVGLIDIEDSDYITIRDLDITHSKNVGIAARNTSGSQTRDITIQGNDISWSEGSGICIENKGTHLRNVYILSNDVSYSNRHVFWDSVLMRWIGHGESISLKSVWYFIVYDNDVRKCHKEGIDAKLGCRHGDIYGNRVFDAAKRQHPTTGADLGYYHADAAIYVDAIGYYTKDIDIYDNVVTRRGRGIVLGFEIGAAGVVALDDIRVFDNLCSNHLRNNSADGFFQGAHCLTVDFGPGGGGHNKKNIQVYDNTFSNEHGVPNISVIELPARVDVITIRDNWLGSDSVPGGNPSKRFIKFGEGPSVPTNPYWNGTHLQNSKVTVTGNTYAYSVFPGTTAALHHSFVYAP